MEIDFRKHFKDATNLLLGMDYDSGYVEAGESSSCTSSNTESSTKMSVGKISRNFLFNEDALLEKPEISLNWNTNLPYEIDLEEYEESRQLFFSPGFINASVPSQNSSLPYSGLESETSSNESTDLPLEKPILVKNKSDIAINEIISDDVLIISASEIDMSLSDEESDNMVYDNLIDGNNGESAINTSEDLSPEDEETDGSFMETAATVNSTDIWSVKKTPKKLSPSKSNPLDTVTNILEAPKEKRRLTLVFCKNEKENNVYSVKRKYPSLTPTKRTPENTPSSSEQAYPCMTREKNDFTSNRTKKSSRENVDCFKHNLSSMTPEKKILESADFHGFSGKSKLHLTPDKACYSGAFNETPSKTPEKTTPLHICPKDNNHSFQLKLTPEKKIPSKLANHNVSPKVNLRPEKKIHKLAAPDKNPKKYNAYVIEVSKTPELANPRENVKKNVFKQKLFNMTPEKKIPEQDAKQNLKQNICPEKTLKKLAANNTLKKYNGDLVEESKTPEKQPPKPVDPYFSPDLFDEADIVDESTSSYSKLPIHQNLLSLSRKSQTTEDKYSTKLDQKLLKRTQKGMSGVLPPPSVTIVHLSAQDILSKWKDNQNYCFWSESEKNDLEKSDLDKSLNNSSVTNNSFSKSLLLSVDLEEAKNAEWPKIYDMRCHGLHYNCGKVSEEIVELCDKYQKRFVGAETQSTCTTFEKQHLSSPSKKTTKPRFGAKSPGRRLSHLALRRKITFSHANSQASSSSLVGSRARQILVDAKKIDLLSRRKSPRKTPKKTPSKSPRIKTRTPSSSAKKKLAMRFRKLTGEFQKSVPDASEMSSTQRALFNSPIRGASQSVNRSTKRALFQSPGSNSNSSSIFSNKSLDLCGSQEKRQFRRNLFASPKKHSPIKIKKSPFKQFGMERKRKRSESDDAPGAKVARSFSVDHKASTSTSDLNKSLSRTQSDCNISLNRSQSHLEFSEQHKKKLIWAVSGALESQNVTSVHPKWKLFASVLARVTRRFYVDQMQAKIGKLEFSTSDRMHRIARHHVISVIKGKTADEIFNDYVAKNRASRVQRPQGYIAPEEFNQSKTAPSGGKENAFQDRSNTMESWEKRKTEQISKPSENRIDRIRKVINFGDDR